ncbi:MAG TPA: hypothetical protein DCP71_04465, partial [Verrucomicrobiales bacterium]|nr:hypothetical protein [Verrucomicrobiales bacterium]
MAMRTIDLKRFLREVKDRHNLQKARPFCFVLGAGASKQSDIPMGGELVDRWLADLHHDADHGGLELSKWATAANLGIKGFVYAQRAEFYGKVYAKRFQGTTDTGHAEIQSLLSGKEPSFGYSILAYILANTPHKAVITTNFDNLVADALYLYSHTAPIQCMHESLAPFISTQLDRPLVVKIHRDLLLDPRSADEEIVKLHTDWERPLTNLLNHFTPIFFGYGGNDGSLMGFLKELPPGVPDRLYWCVRGKEVPNARVKELLDQRDGTLVSIPGFDEIMLALKGSLDIPDLLPDLQDRHKKRVESYQKQFSELNKAVLTASKAPAATSDEKILGEAASDAVKQLAEEDTPDSWILRAMAEPDKNKAEALYREALSKYPNDGNLMCAFGEFLADERQAFKEAEELIRSAYEADPENHDRLHDYGTFLWYSLRDGRQAEPLLREALKRHTDILGPEHPSTLNSRMHLANALDVQGKYAEAEAGHREVLVIRERVLGAEHPDTLSSRNNLANVLYSQSRYDEAEMEHRTALVIRERVQGAEHPDTLSCRNNLAAALSSQSKDAAAEEEYRAVLAIQERVLGAEHPDALRSRNNLANALATQGKYAEAEAGHWEVLVIRERVQGAEHPDTLSSRNNLAN